MIPVITIDGPAASGKSSVSRLLARKLGFRWVSTGAFYRGLAYVAYEKGISAQDESALAKLASDPVWSVELGDEYTEVVYEGRNVTSQIAHEDVGSLASLISRHPKVRAALLAAQRQCAQSGSGLVAEGRDCGTVIFPNADAKFFLTASSADRAARRAAEHGLEVESLAAAQKKRDDQDRNRATAPLQVPEGAHVIETGQMTLEEVVEKVFTVSRPALQL